ncbi:ATP-grasp fold amidoligase family protein [Peribacillus butanolivorans]|uniref:ATP-grasp fold amidoligase family protein n=1 Tax=Peribacillus butanolivorans TaxID=421767 RepID=UPI0036D93D8F
MKEEVKYALAKVLSILPDKLYCSLTFLIKQRRKPNLRNPIYFNDKLLYLKLNDRKPILKELVDKYEVRRYVKEKIGVEYLIPLIGVYNSPEEVDFRNLPNKFALKPTSGAQRNLICTDKNKINWEIASRKISSWLKLDPYMRTREWPYKDLPARFVIEEYIEDSHGNTFDYKFWCFNGKPECVQVHTSRFGNHKKGMYDIEFEKQILDYGTGTIDFPINKPKNYERMVELATKLSEGFPFVRVDLYNLDGNIFFGEMTFYPANCNGKIRPFKYEKIFGDLVLQNK